MLLISSGVAILQLGSRQTPVPKATLRVLGEYQSIISFTAEML